MFELIGQFYFAVMWRIWLERSFSLLLLKTDYHFEKCPRPFFFIYFFIAQSAMAFSFAKCKNMLRAKESYIYRFCQYLPFARPQLAVEKNSLLENLQICQHNLWVPPASSQCWVFSTRVQMYVFSLKTDDHVFFKMFLFRCCCCCFKPISKMKLS